MMILVRLCGGLGNQMFQYALGRRLAADRGVPLKLDITAFADDPLRSYRLSHLRIQAEPATAAELAAYRPWRLPHRLRWLSPLLPSRAALIREQAFPFAPEVLKCPSRAYVDGYWQSERYFAEASELVRSDFQLAAPMSEARQAVVKRMNDTVAVSVHVRRGDYVSNAATLAYHGVCAPEWYARAMARMSEMVAGVTFFVFSDDPEWARANLPRQWPMEFIDPQADGHDFEDMHMMAACRHHITANSSFSWWGAWLNPRGDKHVIVPAQWFIEPLDTKDLIPQGWIRL